MTEFHTRVISLASLLFVAGSAPLLAELPADGPASVVKKSAPGTYIRIARDKDQEPVALETATVRFVPASGKSGAVVDLIGVVHVGDRDYYQKLNKQFEQYDALLYELVAPQGTVIPKGGKRDGGNPLAMMHTIMKTVLALDSQTEHIDYTRKNFVHADLSPSEIAEVIRKRGDTGLTLTLSIAADLLRQQYLQELKKPAPKQEAGLDLLSLLFDPDPAVKLKRMMAVQLAALGTGDGGLGPTLNNIVVSDRNAAALRVLQRELAKGKKKIGIFYGAAHMPDFERRLREEFDLRPESTQWLPAWDMRLRSRGGLEDLLKQLLP